MKEFFTDFHYVCRKSGVPLETMDVRWCMDIYRGYYKHIEQFIGPLKEMEIGKKKSFTPKALPAHLRRKRE